MTTLRSLQNPHLTNPHRPNLVLMPDANPIADPVNQTTGCIQAARSHDTIPNIDKVGQHFA